jgi:hypothetical protein
MGKCTDPAGGGVERKNRESLNCSVAAAISTLGTSTADDRFADREAQRWELRQCDMQQDKSSTTV